jgi:pyruvate formate lyase activating enzyme
MPPVAGVTPIAMIGNPTITMPGIFIGGCNLRCPYCINRAIIGDGLGRLDAIAIVNEHFAAMEKWLFVSGGEPLSNVNTPNLLQEIKARKMKVALATNGTFPERLREVVTDGLVDHIVMDIKTSPSSIEKYMQVCGTGDVKVVEKILSSMEVAKSALACEFRTTCCSKFVDFNVIKEVAGLIGRDYPYVLQYYTLHQTFDPEMSNQLFVVSYEGMLEWAAAIRDLVKWVSVREV